MTTQQIETATVVGTVSSGGNATIIVTSRDMDNSPKTKSVAVSLSDTASVIAGKIRDALAYDADVSEKFLVGGSGADERCQSLTFGEFQEIAKTKRLYSNDEIAGILHG